MEAAFQKLPRSILELRRNHRLFEMTAKAILNQAPSARGAVDAARLAKMPTSAQAVAWLWLFSCEAACGMDVFVLNSLGAYASQIHLALKEVGASELLRLMEAAISMARGGSAEFKSLADQSWFNQFPVPNEQPELDALNKPTFAQMPALSDLAATHIRSHEAELFEPPRVLP